MITRKNSLRQQFLVRIFLVLLITALLSGLVQLYFIRQQIAWETDNQATLVSQSLNNGIEETSEASTAIEHQIDLKLLSMSKNISTILQGKELGKITNEDLKKLLKVLGLAGITLLAERDDDIVGVLSTDPQELGFSLKKVGFLQAGKDILKDRKAQVPGATYVDDGTVVLPISQSVTHNEQPLLYKYAYYHPPGTNYIINPYIESGEVYQFIQKIGPDNWIKNVSKENPYVEEIAVLTPKVFVKSDLEKQIYPPVKKIVHGQFGYQSAQDDEILRGLATQPHKVVSIQRLQDKKIYKLFLPIVNEQVVYIALNYDKLSAPLYRHSIILIVSGFVSLIALFVLTASFFTQIYRNIQKIILQIKQLEKGDLTAKSTVSDEGELRDLSDSTNKMAASLHQLLTGTHEKAIKAQRVSIVLEADANQSVEKVFTMSIETTTTARDSIEEINIFLDQVEEQLEPQKGNPKAKEILDKMDQIRTLTSERTNTATEITITLSDLFKSLHSQSSELSELSNSLLNQLSKFKL